MNILVVTWGELRNCQAWIFNATLHSKPIIKFRHFYLARHIVLVMILPRQEVVFSNTIARNLPEGPRVVLFLVYAPFRACMHHGLDEGSEVWKLMVAFSFQPFSPFKVTLHCIQVFAFVSGNPMSTYSNLKLKSHKSHGKFGCTPGGYEVATM